MSQKISELHPNELVRKKQAGKFLGLKATALDDAIKAGKIPAPIAAYEGGRAKFFTGQQIMDHIAKRIAASAKAEA